ncbi:hypothetical protein CUMW_196820, partial [Citrus unshiu]
LLSSSLSLSLAICSAALLCSALTFANSGEIDNNMGDWETFCGSDGHTVVYFELLACYFTLMFY